MKHDTVSLSGIQSIPSQKAEPFKMWLAQVGRERIEEVIDPELTIERALETYAKAVELIGCQYSSDFESEEDSGQGSFKNNTFDIELDYEGDMDGKLLVSLIVGKYLAGRVNGIAVAEYD